MIRRLMAASTLAVALLTPLASQSARAQDTGVTGEAEESSDGGNPYYGYLGVAFLGAGILFIICKSARR